jgi:hypothetical protein
LGVCPSTVVSLRVDELTTESKPRVVFLSVKFLKKPNCASGLFESLPIDDHCPLLSIADTKPIELSLLPPSDGHSEGLRETGEGYSMAVPLEE